MQKPAPPKLPKPQPQHPHLKTTPKRRYGRPVPSPSRTPRVGTAALAAHVGPGLHSPAGAGTHREGPCRSRRVTCRIAQKLLPRPTPIRKPPPGEARAARDLGSANLPLPGAFSTSRASNVLASYSSNFSATSQTFRLPDPQTLRFPDSQTWLRNRKRPSRAGFWTYTDISNRENQSHECSRPFLIAFPLVRR